MITPLNCIAYDHDPVFFSFAVMTLLIGSVVTMRLFARVRRTEKTVRKLWLLLAGMIGGATIWSTHFVSMLAYNSDLILGYDPLLTLLSLVMAIGTTTLGFYVASRTQSSYFIELGGLILGLGISGMHYVGIASIIVSGSYIWDPVFVGFSVALGVLFGVFATNRIARPATRFCRYGGSIAFCLAVALMHFTGMSGLSIVPMNLDLEVTKLVSDEVLGMGILFVMALLFLTTFLTNLIDVKNAEATTEHYRHLALNDALTGVPNRLGCEQYLTKVLSRKMDDTASVAVLAIDLDSFKNTNDMHGHAAGDHLLRKVSERITDCLRDDEMIGRFGGDEFFAVKSSVYLNRDAIEFGNRILDAVRQPTDWHDAKLETTASIGFSMFPRDGQEPVALMEKADQAMYRGKTDGKNCIIAYDENIDTANKERIALSVDLSKAIANGELEVHYQLQNDTRTREITGVEALLRWHHPTHGTVSPSVFIPLAEETGAIVALGDWVLDRACQDAAAWSEPIKVAVNVASKQISDPEFPQYVHNTLIRTGLSPSRLEIEITESGIIADMGHALHVIRQLKDLGVKVAMDDYGTGYSSLATLQSFPFDKIKIDREFIKEIATNRHSSAIVSSTLILGNSLDIPVLAEGVETEEHLQLLVEKGCQQVQGFLFGKPMKNADLQKILSDKQLLDDQSKAVFQDYEPLKFAS